MMKIWFRFSEECAFVQLGKLVIFDCELVVVLEHPKVFGLDLSLQTS